MGLGLGDCSKDYIRIYSLATAQDFTQNFRQLPRSKTSTVMFVTIPSLIHDDPGKQEWRIPGNAPSRNVDDIILDVHFIGMTPLNDVEAGRENLFDCIAISGLASHPFGSWQPKGGPKTFIWIRDSLPKDLSGARAIIYGYNTKLDDSRSFQSVSDIALAFISQLETYSWTLSSARPVCFLAHSFGGPVLRDAMVQLDQRADEGSTCLLNLMRGAVLFGVPNVAMEQTYFRAIVKNNANAGLVDDVGRDSNYLDRLNESFSGASFRNRLRFFWAYETSKSPTVQVSSAQ
ncbi:hypothetical protein WAI453_000074 [Rhynchosporium graminicola]